MQGICLRAIVDAYGNVVLKGDILKGAREAFAHQRYVEAFALLHAEVDIRMAELYQNIEFSTILYERQHESLDDVLFLLSEQDFRFKRTASLLAELGLIDGKDHRRLLSFNRLRDLIVHRLVIFSHRYTESSRVDLSEIREGFEEGLKLAKLLKDLRSELVHLEFGWMDPKKKRKPS